MKIDRKCLAQIMDAAADEMLAGVPLFNEIDAKFGDGDHGVTIEKIAGAIKDSTERLAAEEMDINEYFDDLGMAVMAVNGGSAGPLYGTMLGGFGVNLSDGENELDGDAVKRMFAGMQSEMEDLTTAKEGEKTMMDAIIPACRAVEQSEGGPEDYFLFAAEAAKKGAEETTQYVSRFGRARSYGEETVGTPDAGAMSTAAFFTGLHKGLE